MNRVPLRPLHPPTDITTFTFDPATEMAEVAGTLMLAELAAASVHGPGRVQLDAGTGIDREARRVRIDTSTEAEQTLALVFLGYCNREFGEDAVTMRRGIGGEEVQS